MKKAGMIALGLLVVLTSQQVAAEVRTWTGSNGSRLEADFVKEVAGKVVLRSTAGKELRVPRSYLAKEDIEYLDLNTPPRAAIVSTVKVSEVELEDDLSADVVKSKISIRKTSSPPYSLPVTATLFLIGVVGCNENYVVLERCKSDLRFTSENRNQPNLEVPAFRLYDINFEGVIGIEYEGYLVVVTDPNGIVLAVESNRTAIEKNGIKLLQCKVGDQFDRNIEMVQCGNPEDG